MLHSACPLCSSFLRVRLSIRKQTSSFCLFASINWVISWLCLNSSRKNQIYLFFFLFFVFVFQPDPRLQWLGRYFYLCLCIRSRMRNGKLIPNLMPMTGLQWQGGIFVFVFVVVFEFVFVFVFVLFLNLINQIQTWCRRLVRSDWGGIFVFVFVFLFVFVFVFLFVFVLNPNLMPMTCPQWLGRHLCICLCLPLCICLCLSLCICLKSKPDADDLSAVTGEASEKTKTSKGVTAAGRYIGWFWDIGILVEKVWSY